MKKTFFAYFAVAISLMAFSFTSCDKEDVYEYVYIDCKTLEAEDITPTTATLKAEINLQNISGGKMYTCFYYSTEKTDLRNLRAAGKKSQVDTLKVQAQSQVSIPIKELKAETTYYYAPALSIQGFEVMGDMRAFTTAKFCYLQPATGITASEATLNALVSLPEEMIGNCVIGFEFTQKDFEAEKQSVEASQPDENGKVSVALNSLQTGTKYYFRAYVLYNAIRIYSEVLYFQTL